MENRRIPATLAEFNFYLKRVNTYLHITEAGSSQMRGEILGMTLMELDTLNNIRMTWSSEDPAHPGIFDLHLNKETKTKVTRQNVLHIMREFSVFFRPLLMRMSVSPQITDGDRLALNIAIPSGKRTQPQAPIKDFCYADVCAVRGGRMKFKCFSDHESKRACIPPRADAVEISYLLRLPHQTAPDGKPVEQPTFNHPDRDTTKFISTRAAFYRDFGLEFRGYQLHYFARWTNTRHPDLSASWTGPFMEYIS